MVCQLRRVGVPVVHHLPGVGKNLQDHLSLHLARLCTQSVSLYSEQRGIKMIRVGLQWFLNQTGAASTTHLEVASKTQKQCKNTTFIQTGGFFRTEAEVRHPNVQVHFFPAQVRDHGRLSPEVEAFQAHVEPLRPTARGEVKLRSANPRLHPSIDPRYLSTEQDRSSPRNSAQSVPQSAGTSSGSACAW